MWTQLQSPENVQKPSFMRFLFQFYTTQPTPQHYEDMNNLLRQGVLYAADVIKPSYRNWKARIPSRL
jgi:hypothetical protein